MAPTPHILDPFLTMSAKSCLVNFLATVPTRRTNIILDPPPPTFSINFNYMEEFCDDASKIFKVYKAKIKKSHEKFSTKSLKID